MAVKTHAYSQSSKLSRPESPFLQPPSWGPVREFECPPSTMAPSVDQTAAGAPATVAEIKARSDRARHEFEDARRRVEAAFNKAQPTSGAEAASSKKPALEDVRAVTIVPVVPKSTTSSKLQRLKEPRPGDVTTELPSIDAHITPPLPETNSKAKKTRRSSKASSVANKDISANLPLVNQKLAEAAPRFFDQKEVLHDHNGNFDGPKAIRLRRATGEAKTHNKLLESVLARGKGFVQPKTDIVDAAVTRTAVHLFTEDPLERERQSTASESHRKLSATLQVVRSRTSVYEVI